MNLQQKVDTLSIMRPTEAPVAQNNGLDPQVEALLQRKECLQEEIARLESVGCCCRSSSRKRAAIYPVYYEIDLPLPRCYLNRVPAHHVSPSRRAQQHRDTMSQMQQELAELSCS